MKRRKLTSWGASVPDISDLAEQAPKNQSIELQLPVAKGSIGLLITTQSDDSDDGADATKQDTLGPAPPD